MNPARTPTSTTDGPLRRKRLIYTVNYSPWSTYSGGGQRSTHFLATEMARRGHDVHLIASKTPFERVQAPENLPYKLHWATLFDIRSRRRAPLRPLTALHVRRLAEHLIRESADPVVLHGNGEEAGHITSLKEKYPFLFVLTPRYPRYPDRIAEWPDLTVPRRILLALRQWKHLTLRKGLIGADLISPPSRWAADTVRQKFGLEEHRVEPVPNGVPPEFLDISRNGPMQSGAIFFFGRFSRDKGVDLLLEAYSRLPEPLPPLQIAGQGEERDSLRQLAGRLRIEQQVEFLPWLTHEQLAERLSSVRLVALPSRHENYSLAILASLAAGVPTISTRTGGTPELIRDLQNGRLVTPDNIQELADTMQQMLEDPRQAEEMARRASLEIRETLTWKHCCDRFEELYDRLLDGLS